MPLIVIDKAKPETIDVEIPSYPGSVVTMLRRLPLQQNRAIAQKYPKAQDRDIEQGYNASLEQLAYAIKDWNFAENVGSEERKFDITPENIGALFSDPDVLLLGAILRGKARQVEGTKWEVMTEEEKKADDLMRVKTWHKLLRNLKVNAKTPEQMDFVRRFSDVMLCREMGWTERQLKEENTEEFYEDCMRVFGMEASHLEGERKLAASRSKHKQ